MFKGKLLRILVNIISVFIILGVSRSLYSLWQKKDIVWERREELVKLEEKQRNLKKKLEEAQSPAFIERTARESLGFVKEGESIVLVPKIENSEQKIENSEDVPNWKKWWKLFF